MDEIESRSGETDGIGSNPGGKLFTKKYKKLKPFLHESTNKCN